MTVNTTNRHDNSVCPYCPIFTPDNLIVVCAHGNSAIGNTQLSHLYDLAGLSHSVEPSIMKGERNAEAFRESLKLSSSIMMYARCKLIGS